MKWEVKPKFSIIIIFLIFYSVSSIFQVSSEPSYTFLAPNQDLTIPPSWFGCQPVAGNVNNALNDINSSNVISSFWNALIGMQLGETKHFVIPYTDHPYTGSLLGKDLFYIVRIDNIDLPNGATTVTSSSQVDVFYSLYLDCSVMSPGPQITVEESPNFINSTIPINVVFIGFDESVLDLNRINSSLTHWYAPTILYPFGVAGGNFTLDIEYYLSNSTSLESDFLSYLTGIASWGPAPADLLAYDSGASGAWTIPASSALSWLDNNINNYFGSINNTYSLYIINTYTWGYITDYYYYELYFPDPDTGIESNEKLTILYGGDYPHRGVFLDLSAGPVLYHESQTSEDNEGVSNTTIQPIWEYSFPLDIAKLNDNLTEYIQETIDLVFTPSYIYEPVVKSRYDMMVYLIDNTSTGTIYNNALDYVNTTLIDNTLNSLIPYSDWNTSYYVNYLSNYPVLSQIIKGAYEETNQTEYPFAVYPDQAIIDYLANNKAKFGMTEETIPVFLFAWDETLFLGGASLLARAERDENGNPLMVIGGYNPADYPDMGYSHLIIHELGHIFGLRHPHDGWSWDNYNDTGNPTVLDWLRDFISTPMSYAHRDVSFSTFDYDSLDRGHVFQRLNSTWQFLYSANETLLNKGHQYLDSVAYAFLTLALDNLTLSLQFFDSLDFHSAFFYANLSFISALHYYNFAFLQPDLIPQLTAPTDGINFSHSNIMLEWGSVVNAVEYRVIIADNPQFNAPIVNITTTSTSLSIPELSDGTYYWTVQAKVGEYWAIFSPARTFIIKFPITTTSNPSDTSGLTTSKDTSSSLTSSIQIISSTPGFSIISLFIVSLIPGLLFRRRRRRRRRNS